MPRVPNISRAEAAKRRSKLAPAAPEPTPDRSKVDSSKKAVKKKSLRKR